MPSQTVPVSIQAILMAQQSPEHTFAALLPALGEYLRCDRCFLYLRHPQTRLGKVPFCWRRSPDFPEVLDADWKPEPPSLVADDPMFAAAVHGQPSVFVEDVETAAAEVVNRQFEQENFGHRALIHAHLRQNGECWGILQPCVFNSPRAWEESDRQLITEIVQQITPLAVTYVQQQSRH